jgi:hypothetical protein
MTTAACSAEAAAFMDEVIGIARSCGDTSLVSHEDRAEAIAAVEQAMCRLEHASQSLLATS